VVGIFVVSLAALCVMTISPEDVEAVAESTPSLQVHPNTLMREAKEMQEMNALAVADDPPADADAEAPAPAPVAPLINPASKVRASVERAKLQAREEKRVKTTIAKAKAAVVKAANDVKVEKTKAKLKKKIDEAKEQAADFVARQEKKELDGKTREKTVMDRIAVNQREKFEAIAQITKKAEDEAAAEKAAQKAKWKHRNDKMKATIAKGVLDQKAAADEAMKQQEDAFKAEADNEKAHKEGVKKAADAIETQDEHEIQSKKAYVTKENQAKKEQSDKYNRKLQKRTDNELKDKKWAAEHDPLKLRFERLARESGESMRRMDGKAYRKWRRSVSEDAIDISAQGRAEMRQVRRLARKASSDIEKAAKNKLKPKQKDQEEKDPELWYPDLKATSEPPQVQKLEALGRSAEFKFDAADDAAEKAWQDVRSARL